MMNENVRSNGMNPLLKSLFLVLVFGIVAMPFVGISLVLRRESGPITRVIGLILVMISVAAWGYLGYYSTHSS